MQRTPSTLSISYIVCEASQKLPQLVAFLQVAYAAFCVSFSFKCAVSKVCEANQELPQLVAFVQVPCSASLAPFLLFCVRPSAQGQPEAIAGRRMPAGAVVVFSALIL